MSETPTPPAAAVRQWNRLSAVRATRAVLFLGFGGLLALLGVAAFGALQLLHEIQTLNNTSRREFVSRDHALESIRSELYLSGTYMRDYLLDPDPAAAAAHLASLRTVRRRMDADLRHYQRRLTPSQVVPFRGLRAELSTYWDVLEPALRWSPPERRTRGYTFLAHEILPRRAGMLRIADQIAAVNDRELSQEEHDIAVLYGEFRKRSVIIAAVTLGLGLLLAAFTTVTVMRLEREAAQRFKEVEQARSELRELSARLVQAQENERRSISRELHDEVGQSMSAALVELGNLSASLPPGSAAREHAGVIRHVMETCLAEVRNMALLLRPSMLDDLGLLPALQWQAREVSKRTGLKVSVAAENLPEDLPEAFNTCVYRVVQEALHNISRHAAAASARVTVSCEGGRLSVGVQDDGKGFRPALEKGMGLLGMHERVERLGGTLRIDSEPGLGSLISVVLPLPAGVVSPERAGAAL